MDDYKIIVEQEHQTVMAHYEVEPKPDEGYQSEAALEESLIMQLKGKGNMELTLNRALSERRIFPAIDLPKSSTRREDLLLSPVEQEANLIMRRAFGGARAEEATEAIVNMFTHTRSNAEFITQLKRTRMFG
jgi:transcription termination factor Rho